MQPFIASRRLLSFSRFFAGAFAVAFLMLCSAPAFGQAQNTGTVAGTVADASHGIVPGAAVTLTSEDRGNVYHATSNGQGEYTFNDVPVGGYTLMVSAPTFSTFISHHIAVDSDTRLRVDAELKAGKVDVQLEVTADAVAVDTQGATVSQVLDNELVENLPIDGNNVVALAALLPGVTDVSAPTTFTDENGGATFNANGARGNSNLFLFDGLLWNNLFLNTGINYPNHAVLHQVSIQLNNFSAQYGRNAGSIFNVVSKEGTNKTHGEIFFHYHDSMFDAQNYFSKSKPPQHTYQFGGAVGGPIIKDKLFYEAEFQSLVGFTAVQANAETLSMAERGFNADGSSRSCVSAAFSGMRCASFAGDAKPGADPSTLIYNPVQQFSVGANVSNVGQGSTHGTTAINQLNSTYTATGGTLSGTANSPCVTLLSSLPSTLINLPPPPTGTGGTSKGYFLPNAEVPDICLDPTAQAIIKAGYIPVPDTQLGTSQFLFSSAQSAKPQYEYGGFARVDYNMTPRQTLSFRGYRTDNTDSAANGGANADTGVPTYGIDNNATYISAGSVTHTLIVTPNLLNVATLGYKRYDYGVTPTDTHTLNSFGSTFQYPGFQSLPTVNINTRFTLGNSQNAFTHSVNENFELLDNISLVRGRHNMQFGVDILHSQYLNIRTNVGRFDFYGNPGYTNAQASDFILGLLYQESVGNGQRISAIQNAIYGYFQDTWRVLPRMTLSLGLRYELPMSWYQPDGQAATFIRGYQSQVFKNAPANLAFIGDQGIPKGLINSDYTNLSPRIGIAYDVFGNGKTAIRAGFGTFYDAVPATIVGLSQPFTYRAFYQLPNGSLTNPLAGLPAIPSDFTPANASFTTPYSVTYPDPHFRNAYVYGVNFGFQQQLNKGTILEVNYLGRFARHLLMALDQNEAIYDCSGKYYQANPSLYCVGQPTSNPAGRARYPGFNVGGGGVVDIASEATANYNALQVTIRQRSYKNLTMLANYTYSRTIDEQSTLSVGSNTPQPSNIGYQYGPSDQNTTQIFNMGYRLALPKVKSHSSVVKTLANDWAFNGIYNARTGHPVNLTFGGDIYGNDEQNQRVYLNPGYSATLPSNRHRAQKIAAWFNTDPNAFRKPDNFTLGNVGRNSIIGPAYINTQFSLTKNISFTRFREGTRGQFRVEAFNAFNTINLGQPRSSYSSTTAQASTFGSINSGGTNPNRRIQFGFILYF